MFDLHYSNRMERLCVALGRQVELQRRTHPLRPVALLTPNRNVAAYLKLELARTAGIAANLEIARLERWTAELAASAGARLVDREALRGLLLAELLDDERLARPGLEAVRAWIHGAGGAPAEAVDLRRFQLAGRLAELFEEYGFSRPGLLAAWRAGNGLFESTPGPAAETERWQRALWRDLFGDDGLARRRGGDGAGTRWLTLAELVTELPDLRPTLPAALHVFGFSYVSPVFHELFARLAQKTALHVYALNPCREYWEDVPSRRGAPKAKKQLDLFAAPVRAAAAAPSDPAADDDAPALRLWGRPGRDNIRRLSALAEFDFAQDFVDPAAERPTLLAAVQQAVLDRAPARAAPPEGTTFATDGSLIVRACPGVRRELEVVAAAIWDAVDADRTLKLNEIAVILNGRDLGAYLAHLPSVFGEHHELPHHVVDLPLAGVSRVAQAMELLLALPLGRFTRGELLRLIAHPNVTARFADADPEAWIAWCDRLGIVHGADHTDHAGSYVERDVFNWDQGMRRLALGAFLTGPQRGEARPFVLGEERYFPEELGEGLKDDAGRLALLVRSLIADARAARAERLTLPEWASFLGAMVSAYLCPAGDDAAARGEDERDLLECLRAVRGIAEVDVDGRAVPFRIAAELVRAALGGLTGARGTYLAEGVAVSSFLPMRAIPFRHVFVLGLGEGRFPAADRRDVLDLRQAEHRPGDVSDRERDRYLFLETLLSTRERLTLSYVARDPLTGDPLEPSSVLLELFELLDRSFVVDARTMLTRRHPLRRHEDHMVTARAPAARREAQAVAIGASLRAAEGAAGQALPSVRELARTIDPETWPAVADALGVVDPPAGRSGDSPPAAISVDAAGAAARPVVKLTIAALRRFLECPLQGSARTVLGLREGNDEDTLAVEDEPFATGAAETTSLLRDTILDAARAGDDPADVYEERAARLVAEGKLPAGVFGEVEREAHEGTLATWQERLVQVGGGRLPRLEIVRFGGGEEGAHVDRFVDPVVLEVTLPGGATRVEIHGRSEPMVLGGDVGAASVLLLRRRQRSRTDEPAWARKDALRAFLDQAMLAASGAGPRGGHTAQLCFAADTVKEPVPVRLAPIAPAEARAWLAAVVHDLFSGAHAYLLPCEAVFDFAVRAATTKPKDLEDCVVDLRDSERSYASLYGPVKQIDRFEPPCEAEGRQIVHERFGAYLERIVSVGVGEAESDGEGGDS